MEALPRKQGTRRRVAVLAGQAAGILLSLVWLACPPALAQTQVANTATVQPAPGQLDSNAGNNSDSVTTAVYAIALAKTAAPASGTAVAIGDTITYTLTATVSGATTTAPRDLTDTLGPGLSFVTPLPAGCSAAGQVLTCSLPAGTAVGATTFTYSATVQPTAGTSVNNGASGGDDCSAGCTTTHPVARAIVLDKDWTNAIAGNEVALSIAGALNAVGGTSVANAASSPATANAVGGATVTLSESFSTGSAANYTSTLSCTRDADGGALAVGGSGLSGSITMPADSDVTCRFANVRREATLTLAKTWVNALSGETATVSSSGFQNTASSGVSTSTGNNTTTGTAVTVYAGESGTISETLSNAGNYIATLACSGNATPLSGNTLTIAPVDTAITCTQTNTRRVATLTLRKTWIDAAVGEAITLSATGGQTSPMELLSVADTASETDSSAAFNVYAGESLTLAEAFAVPANAPNYFSGLNCTGSTGLSGNTLTVGAGDTAIICTHTNTRSQATLRLTKVWAANSRNGDVAQLASTTGLLNNTSAFTSTASIGANSTTVVVYAGEQASLPAETMSGGALANYGVNVACSGGSLSGSDGKTSNILSILPADQGNLITCAYTNTRNSTTLQLQKTWLNAYATDQVGIVATGLTPLGSTATGGPTQTDTGPVQTIYAGDVINITESFTSVTSNLYTSTLACTNTSGLVVTSQTSGTLTVGAADTQPIVCGFTNDRVSAQLIVRKVWSGNSPGATVSIPSSTGFSNNTPPLVSTFPGPDQTAPVTVYGFENGTLGAENFTSGNAGDYTSTVTCDGSDTNPADGLNIPIADAGSTITCTYSNAFVQRPALDVEKTTPVTSVAAVGDVIPYTISATNTGNVPLTNVVVDDPLVSNLVCTPTTPVASLAVGASISCTGSYTVTQADVDRAGSGDGSDNDTVTNTVTATGADPDGGTVTDTDTTDTTLPARNPNATFTKNAALADSNGSGSASAGEVITYSFSVTNTGNTTFNTVVVTDPRLPNLQCSPMPPLEPGETVTFGTQPPADVACTGNTYTVTQADLDDRGGGDGDIDNTAQGTATGTTGNTVTRDASTNVPLDPPAPQILLDKSANPSQVTDDGQVITYTFVVTNPGNVTVNNIGITDPMAGMSAITCTPAQPFSLAPGASATCTSTYTVTQDDIDNLGAITNTATATGDFNGTPITDSDGAVVNINAGPGAAQITKTADRAFVTTVGEVITYTISVNNTSARTVENVRVIEDSLLGAGLVCAVIPSLAPGTSATFSCTGNTYAVQQSDIDAHGNPVPDSTFLTNTVRAAADYQIGADPPVTVEGTASANVRLPLRTPSLFLTKSSDVASVTGPNQAITYSFQVFNNGNVTLTNVSLSDDLLAGLACPPIASIAPTQTLSFAGCTGNVYTVTQGDIDTGSTDVQPGDGQIDNIAAVTATTPSGLTVSDFDENEVNLPVPSPNFSLVKAASVTSISAPGIVSYTFTVTNSGNVTLQNVALSDPTLGLTCPATSIPPGQARVFGGAGSDVVCTGTTRAVTQNDIDTLTSLDNTVTGSGTTDLGITLNRSSSVSVPIVRNAVLTFTKTPDVASVAQPGDVITYTLVGTNSGNQTLQNVNVADPMLGALTCTPTLPIAALAPGAGFSCTGSYVSQPSDFDTLGGGDQDIDNTATASWTGGSRTASAAVQLPLPSQSLSLDKTAATPTIAQGLDPAVTDAGDTITYTFVVTNTGNQTLATVAVIDANLDAPAVCDRTTIIASGPDEVATCTGVHTITQAEMDNGLVSNTATAQGTPPNSARVSSAPDNATVILNPAPSITLDKTAGTPTTSSGALPGATDAGDTLTFSFSVTNSGNVTLNDITVADPLPGTGPIVCPPGQVAPGVSITCSTTVYTLTQANMDAGVLNNTATATGEIPSGATVTDDDSTTTPLAPTPALTLDKTSSIPTYATAGQAVTYSYLVRNSGSVTLSALAVADDRVAAVTCPVTTLAPGASTTCTGTYTITQADVDAGSVTNNATATATPAQGTLAPVTDTLTITANQAPALALDKSTPTASFDSVGDIISYSYLVTNNGNVTITAPITVTDDRTTASCPALPAGGLPPTGTLTCTATYTVTQADLDAGQVTNIASASDGTVTSPTDTVTVNGSQAPALTLDKTTTTTSYDSVGDVIAYSYLVTNTGNITLTTAITVADDRTTVTCPALPPGGLAPTASLTCAATYSVTQADIDAGQVVNIASASSGAVTSPTDTVTVAAIQQPALSIDKSTTTTTYAAVGDVIAYSYLVTNSGNTTITAPITVSDDRTATTCPALPGGGLPPAGTITCTASYAVTQADLDAGQVTNIASASDGTTTSPTDTVTVTGTQTPGLSLDKSSSTPDYDSVGDVIAYSYLVTNSGNTTITAPITVNDDRTPVACPALPAGGLPPTGTLTCTASYTVTQGDLDSGRVINIARATDGTTNSAFDTVTVNAVQTPAIAIDKTAAIADTNGDGVVGDAGDTITYSFSLTNTGNVLLAPVTVTDARLPSLSCTVASLPAGATAACTATGNTYVITPLDETTGDVINTAIARGTPPGGLPDVTGNDTVTTPTLPTPATTTVSKLASPASGTAVARGEAITYTVTTVVANAATHEELTLTDTLSAGLDFTAVQSAGAYLCNAASPLVCRLPTGTPAGSYPLVYTATVAADALGTVNNQVVATKPLGIDPDPVCTSCRTEHPVTPSTATVSKVSDPVDGAPVNPGQSISFTLTTVIAGSSTSEPITLTDTPTAGLTFGTVTSAGAYSCSGSLVCTLPAGTVPGSYPVTYTSTVNADAVGTVGNTVVATNPPGGDPEPQCTDCDTSHLVNRPALDTAKAVTANADEDGNGRVSTGDTLTYTVTATNTGNTDLINVTISDDRITPANTTCAQLAPAQSCVLVGTYMVTQADTDRGTIPNVALVVTEPPPDYPPLSPDVCPAGSLALLCRPSTLTPVPQLPGIGTTKTARLTTDGGNPRVGNVGDVITYHVTVTNTGNVTLDEVAVADIFQQREPTRLTCPQTRLAPRESMLCDPYTHTITEEDAGQGTLENVAIAEGQADRDGTRVAVDDTATADVEVRNEPAQIRASKVASVRVVNVGDLVRYTVTLQNVGEIDLVDGYLIDTPAPGFSYVQGSMQGDDDDHAVTVTGVSPLRVSDLDIAAGNTATLVYLMRVGAGARPGALINRAQAFELTDEPASNVATAEVTMGSDPLLDESLIAGSSFSDRDGDGWHDDARLTDTKVRGGFRAESYVPGSTTIDRGQGEQAVTDASAPLLHGIDLGVVDARQSQADPASAHQIIVRQTLREPAFTDDFVLVSDEGFRLTMDAAGATRVETRGDAAKGLTAAVPQVERQVAQTAQGVRVAYVIRNDGIAERGIPGVRIVSVEGLIIETDQYGRYHLTGIDAGDSPRGRNFILKVDPATLPDGAVFTTDNPQVRRITGGVPARFDFGIKLPEDVITGTRTVEMELGEVAFAAGSAQWQPRYQSVLDAMVAQIREHGGGEVIITADGETVALAFERATVVRDALFQQLDAPLRDKTTLSVRTQVADPSTQLAGLTEGGWLLGTILFETDSDRVRPRYDALIAKLAQDVEAHRGGGIAIVGHADRRGAQAYNEALGLRRAKAVYDAIAARLSPDVRARLRVDVRASETAPVDVPTRMQEAPP